MSSNYERDKASYIKYQKENISRVVINLKSEDKAEWERVAKASGMPLATLLRKLMANYIANHVE